ncbi:uncharacterized protein A1O9_00751 [Exophiala aquamarina CBS 119918]|uniref:Xylanolytic transcriptional activator regulatory domain-containing protein n=1 Tax=Exophiala aquamarina CBS 119918 TaxID=1182545 RepID=A0A072PTZ5_9EURO|nr:uncharacterized protein A1O9_00751 [Exophiala aquamarina CBS 119918]KEF62778.1 hypothetical protein A1O9_00751 [Exophiala aquamarina CBS 119918]
MAGSFLPPRLIADGYVNQYFQTSHNLYPVLEKASFIGRYEHFWGGLPTEGQGFELWIAVLYMVMALGHQCSTIDPDPSVRTRALECTDGEMCFLMARSTFADVPFRGGDLSAATSMFLGFIWLYNQQRFHESYAILGAAARVGYAIGLHRQPSQLENPKVATMKTLWWCLFIYETELATFSGRPCAIQPREVDVEPFPLDTSPTDLQYIETMRQFSHMTWDAYEKVYSLSYRHMTIGDRIDELRKHDGVFVSWYDSWLHESSWSREPYGLILRLRYLNIRILLHRAFLNLTILRTKKGRDSRQELISAAASCVKMALSFVTITTESIHISSSGIIQAALFHVIGYLWNATMTLLLYAKNRSIHAVLSEKGVQYQEVVARIELAIEFFATHQDGSSTAQTAARKITLLVGKLQDSQRGSQSLSPETSTFMAAPGLESPDQPLEFLSELNDPGFIFSDNSFPTIFGLSPSPIFTRGENTEILRTDWPAQDDAPPFYEAFG